MTRREAPSAYIFVGSSENIKHSLHDLIMPTEKKSEELREIVEKLNKSNLLIWGLKSRYAEFHKNRLKKGDIAYLYSPHPVRGLVLKGMIVDKYIGKRPYWPIPEDINTGQGIWPYRFVIEVTEAARGSISLDESWKGIISFKELENLGIRGLWGSYYHVYGERKRQLESLINQYIQRGLWKKLRREIIVSPLSVNDLLVNVKPDLKLLEMLIHIISGKNLLIAGPPGVGKTRIMIKVASLFCGEGNFLMETADSEWSKYNLILGSTLKRGQVERIPGLFTKAVVRCWKSLVNGVNGRSRPYWFLIDEINRAKIETAMGMAFTLLDTEYRSNQALLHNDELMEIASLLEGLPNELRDKFKQTGLTVPYSFRVLATMNTYDRSLLFSIGFALQRRFAQIEIQSPLVAEHEEVPTIPKVDSQLVKYAMEIRERLTNRWKDLAKDVIRRLSLSNKEYNDYFTVVKLDIPYLEKELNSILISERGSWPFDIVFGLAGLIQDTGVADLGSQIIDCIQFYICGKLMSNEFDETDLRMFLVDKAISAYMIPQIEISLPRLRYEQFASSTEIKSAFDELRDYLKKYGLLYSYNRFERMTRRGSMLG